MTTEHPETPDAEAGRPYQPSEEVFDTGVDNDPAGTIALGEAFEWSLGRYPQTYRDLAK